MIRPFLLACGLLACLGPAGGEEPPTLPETDAAGVRLMESLSAEPSGCPDLRAPYGPFHVAICGRVASGRRDADALKAAVDAQLPLTAASARPQPFRWAQEGPRHWRPSHVDGYPVTVGFNRRSGRIAFLYPLELPSCLEDTSIDRLRPSQGFRGAAKIEGSCSYPDFPERARVKRTGGTVVLETTVSAEGLVTAVCVKAVDPRGYGFEAAAIEWHRECRFEPATVDGKAVPSRFDVWTVFELR